MQKFPRASLAKTSKGLKKLEREEQKRLLLQAIKQEESVFNVLFPFLQPSQIRAKAMTRLGVPGVCGEINWKAIGPTFTVTQPPDLNVPTRLQFQPGKFFRTAGRRVVDEGQVNRDMLRQVITGAYQPATFNPGFRKPATPRKALEIRTPGSQAGSQPRPTASTGRGRPPRSPRPRQPEVDVDAMRSLSKSLPASVRAPEDGAEPVSKNPAPVPVRTTKPRRKLYREASADSDILGVERVSLTVKETTEQEAVNPWDRDEHEDEDNLYILSSDEEDINTTRSKPVTLNILTLPGPRPRPAPRRKAIAAKANELTRKLVSESSKETLSEEVAVGERLRTAPQEEEPRPRSEVRVQERRELEVRESDVRDEPPRPRGLAADGPAARTQSVVFDCTAGFRGISLACQESQQQEEMRLSRRTSASTSASLHSKSTQENSFAAVTVGALGDAGFSVAHEVERSPPGGEDREIPVPTPISTPPRKSTGRKRKQITQTPPEEEFVQPHKKPGAERTPNPRSKDVDDNDNLIKKGHRRAPVNKSASENLSPVSVRNPKSVKNGGLNYKPLSLKREVLKCKANDPSVSASIASVIAVASMQSIEDCAPAPAGDTKTPDTHTQSPNEILGPTSEPVAQEATSSSSWLISKSDGSTTPSCATKASGERKRRDRSQKGPSPDAVADVDRVRRKIVLSIDPLPREETGSFHNTVSTEIVSSLVIPPTGEAEGDLPPSEAQDGPPRPGPGPGPCSPSVSVPSPSLGDKSEADFDSVADAERGSALVSDREMEDDASATACRSYASGSDDDQGMVCGYESDGDDIFVRRRSRSSPSVSSRMSVCMDCDGDHGIMTELEAIQLDSQNSDLLSASEDEEDQESVYTQAPTDSKDHDEEEDEEEGSGTVYLSALTQRPVESAAPAGSKDHDEEDDEEEESGTVHISALTQRPAEPTAPAPARRSLKRQSGSNPSSGPSPSSSRRMAVRRRRESELDRSLRSSSSSRASSDDVSDRPPRKRLGLSAASQLIEFSESAASASKSDFTTQPVSEVSRLGCDSQPQAQQRRRPLPPAERQSQLDEIAESTPSEVSQAGAGRTFRTSVGIDFSIDFFKFYASPLLSESDEERKIASGGSSGRLTLTEDADTPSTPGAPLKDRVSRGVNAGIAKKRLFLDQTPGKSLESASATPHADDSVAAESELSRRESESCTLPPPTPHAASASTDYKWTETPRGRPRATASDAEDSDSTPASPPGAGVTQQAITPTNDREEEDPKRVRLRQAEEATTEVHMSTLASRHPRVSRGATPTPTANRVTPERPVRSETRPVSCSPTPDWFIAKHHDDEPHFSKTQRLVTFENTDEEAQLSGSSPQPLPPKTPFKSRSKISKPSTPTPHREPPRTPSKTRLKVSRSSTPTPLRIHPSVSSGARLELAEPSTSTPHREPPKTPAGARLKLSKSSTPTPHREPPKAPPGARLKLSKSSTPTPHREPPKTPAGARLKLSKSSTPTPHPEPPKTPSGARLKLSKSSSPTPQWATPRVPSEARSKFSEPSTLTWSRPGADDTESSDTAPWGATPAPTQFRTSRMRREEMTGQPQWNDQAWGSGSDPESSVASSAVGTSITATSDFTKSSTSSSVWARPGAGAGTVGSAGHRPGELPRANQDHPDVVRKVSVGASADTLGLEDSDCSADGRHYSQRLHMGMFTPRRGKGPGPGSSSGNSQASPGSQSAARSEVNSTTDEEPSVVMSLFSPYKPSSGRRTMPTVRSKQRRAGAGPPQGRQWH